jgi:catechol 2,3-dioxygenase-like lactoylglutathione lyase family enzyme
MEKTMKPKISIITLGVTDLERSTKFYRDGLGFPTHGDFPGITFFSLAGTWLALFPRDELAADAQLKDNGTGFGGVTLAHNVGSKEEVDQVMNEARKAGAKILKPAQDTDWGGYSGYFSDPDGFPWEVAWNPHFDLT